MLLESVYVGGDSGNESSPILILEEEPFMKKTEADIKAAQTAELVAIYNEHAENPVKKFRDRATAEARVLDLLESLGKLGKEEAPKAQKKVGGKRDTYENRIINLLVAENPKRVGSRAHAKFAILMKFDGKPLIEYKNQEGKHPTLDNEKGWPATELRWALSLGLAKLQNPVAKAA